MAPAKGEKLIRHQTVKRSLAAPGGGLYVIKAWHSDGRKRRWITIAYKPTQREAYTYAIEAAKGLGDRSVCVWHRGRKLRQWKRTIRICCPSCGWQGTVAMERKQWGGP